MGEPKKEIAFPSCAKTLLCRKSVSDSSYSEFRSWRLSLNYEAFDRKIEGRRNIDALTQGETPAQKTEALRRNASQRIAIEAFVYLQGTIDRSSGLTQVMLQHSAQAFMANHFSLRRRFARANFQRRGADALMRPLFQIMDQVFIDQVSQVILAEDDEMVQTLALDGKNPAFRMSIEIWSGRAYFDDLDSLRFKQRVECLGEFRRRSASGKLMTKVDYALCGLHHRWLWPHGRCNRALAGRRWPGSRGSRTAFLPGRQCSRSCPSERHPHSHARAALFPHQLGPHLGICDTLRVVFSLRGGVSLAGGWPTRELADRRQLCPPPSRRRLEARIHPPAAKLRGSGTLPHAALRV